MNSIDNNMYMESVTIKAYMAKAGDMFVVFSKDNGGTIVSDENEENAKKKFEAAMRISFSLKNLIFYAKSIESYRVKDKDPKVFRTPNLEFEFISTAA